MYKVFKCYSCDRYNPCVFSYKKTRAIVRPQYCPINNMEKNWKQDTPNCEQSQMVYPRNQVADFTINVKNNFN